MMVIMDGQGLHPSPPHWGARVWRRAPQDPPKSPSREEIGPENPKSSPRTRAGFGRGVLRGCRAPAVAVPRDAALGTSPNSPSPFLLGPGSTCLVGGVLVDDADILAVREPQESEIFGSLQVVLQVIQHLQQTRGNGAWREPGRTHSQDVRHGPIPEVSPAPNAESPNYS